MQLNEYETCIIVRADLDDAVVDGIAEKVETTITDNDGRVLLRDDWGKRKLAYPIRKAVKGHYFLMMYLAPAAAVAELERKIRIEDNIIRFMTVTQGEAVDVDARVVAADELRKIKEEEAAKAKAEAEARAAAEREALANTAPVREEAAKPEAPAAPEPAATTEGKE